MSALPRIISIVAALLIAVAHASVLTNPQAIIDGYNVAHPHDGMFVVLVPSDRVLREEELRPVVNRFDAGRYTVLTVHSTHRVAVEQLYPGAVVSDEKRVFAAQSAVWNLDRIDERERSSMDGTWTGPSNGGHDVHAYVVDSGIDIAHPEFGGGRASHDFTAFGSTHSDSCGHGTHVAGSLGGATHGVARGVNVHSVKVLTFSGGECVGTTGTLAAGLSHVLSAASGQRVVINLSVGFYGIDSVIGALIADLHTAGHVVVAAAGNDATSACSHYPSAYAGVLSVAASNSLDVAASFSNYGDCVDLYGPGVAVRSAAAGGTGFVEYSGTSMASPHVAGVVAIMRHQQPSASRTTIITELLQVATTGVVTNRNGSPDLLVYWAAEPEPQPSTAPQSSTGGSTTSAASTTLRPCVATLVLTLLYATYR